MRFSIALMSIPCSSTIFYRKTWANKGKPNFATARRSLAIRYHLHRSSHFRSKTKDDRRIDNTMLRRRKDELPTTLPSTGGENNGFGVSSNFGTYNNGGIPDGSGKSIKMDAPLVKAFKSASGITKYSYVWLGVSVLFVWCGWGLISRNSGEFDKTVRLGQHKM
eukprot:scaffold6179_cov92-Cyclotella_meneghiniana.AAC.3